VPLSAGDAVEVEEVEVFEWPDPKTVVDPHAANVSATAANTADSAVLRHRAMR
jgi:hypothetical protein